MLELTSSVLALSLYDDDDDDDDDDDAAAAADDDADVPKPEEIL